MSRFPLKFSQKKPYLITSGGERISRSRLVGGAIPNFVTFVALFMGLSAVRFAMDGQWSHAVLSILVAAVLDGLDGGLARFLGVASHFGAELDSLADFLNFGIAPVFVVYCAALKSWGALGWSLCLFFAACMAFRLARFNTMRIEKEGHVLPLFSVGMPAPAGGLLILTPVIYGFCFSPLAPWYSALTLVFSALLMVSRYPTFVLKRIIVPGRHMRFMWLVMFALSAALVSAPWPSILICAVLYVLSLPVSGYMHYYGPRRKFSVTHHTL